MTKATKILVICGPTAVGKTDLALHLAHEFEGVLIAADSRQVYRGLDIGSGKYSPKDSFKKFSGKWLLKDVWIHGYDLAEPNKRFTAADFAKFFWKTVNKIWKRGKLPILVGGTGFYIMAALKGFETLGIPPNPKLRQRLGRLSTEKLFNQLLEVDKRKAEVLSPTEAKNPRRLIRAIEVAKFKKSYSKIVSTYPYINMEEANALKIGLTCPREILYQKIDRRVDERINMGMIEEVKKLLAVEVSNQRLKALGLEYRYLTELVLGEITRAEAISKLKFAIHDAARRQLTWFRREKDIIWFDITDRNFYQKVEKLSEKWYSN